MSVGEQLVPEKHEMAWYTEIERARTVHSTHAQLDAANLLEMLHSLPMKCGLWDSVAISATQHTCFLRCGMGQKAAGLFGLNQAKTVDAQCS